MTVGRMSLAATSLVAAIPAGLLCYFLVMAFVNNASNLVTMLQVAVGVTALACLLVAVMPVGILLFGGARKSSAATSEKASKGAATTTSDDEIEELVDVTDDETEPETVMVDESDPYAETVTYDSSAELEDLDVEEEIDFFEEEETKPAKKKKK